MEQAKSIIELLVKIDFIFWPLVIILFRKQIINILNRVVTIKSPVGEICLVPEKSKIVEKFKNVQNMASSLLPEEDGTKNMISEGLQSPNRELLIDAVKRISVNTRYFWPTLVLAYEKRLTLINELIRETTFLKIKNDLELLKRFGLLTYSNEYKCLFFVL